MRVSSHRAFGRVLLLLALTLAIDRAAVAGHQVVPPTAPPATPPVPTTVRPTDTGPAGSAGSANATLTDPLASTEPNYPDDQRLRVALRMLGAGNAELARMTAATVLVEKPDCDRAAAIQGIALNKLKRYEEAKPLLDRARRSSQAFPEQRHAAHFLGWCCYHLGQLDESRAAFEQHLAIVPGEPDSTFGLGIIALDEDRLDDAEKSFARALEGFTAPEDRRADRARVLVRMSDLALRRDDVVGAERLLRRAIEASAVQHEAWSKLARVSDRLGKTQEADAARANAERILIALGRKAGDAASEGGAASATPQNATPPQATPPAETPKDAASGSAHDTPRDTTDKPRGSNGTGTS